MAAPMVRVRRMGRLIQLPARELVPGDVFLVEAGDVIPADARLLEAANLRVQEASLTGESQPVDKHLDLLNDPDAALGDRHNMVYLGTSVTYGRGEGVVVATGMGTQLGRIAEMIQSVESEKTPLQRRMDELGRVLIAASVIIMGIAFFIGILSGDSLEDVALNAVAIAVAVVPEGLPAVVTIALALGAQRMLRRNALIRKLPAVETLGSVTTIASDKTGTLTENRMTVTIMDVAGQRDDMDSLAGQGMAALLNANGTERSAALSSDALVLAGGTLASDASLNDELAVIGDPTEGAIVVAAARFGLHQRDLTTAFPRIDELPFDSDRKRMTTVHRVQAGPVPEPVAYLASLLDLQAGDRIAFVKGAVDPLLDITTHAWMEGGVSALTPETRRGSRQQTTIWRSAVCVCWAWPSASSTTARRSTTAWKRISCL
ncbi:HAD-IC family P-type ATPase [bacterium]|nr:HAD-IC family P-type ATPase [bacterium]